MAIVLALSCLSILSSCSKKEEPKELSFPVDIAEVLQMDVPIYLKGIGTLEASSVVYIRPQVSGILTDVLYEEGSFVKKDDLLITIDSRMYEANLEIARAMLSSEEADYRLNYDITRRMANLVGENYVSEVEYEKSLTRLEGSHANIEKTHAEIKKAEIDLSYTQIYSPISGYIGEKHFDKGNYVTPGDHHALVVINKVTPLEVAFSLPSTYLDQLREKQKERPLYLMCERASKGKPIDGVLDFIDNEVNKHTGMIPLKGIIPNKDERGWPGEFVRVHLLLETLENATVVPTEAIVIGQDEDFVWVVNEETMRVELRS
ncbi:MAG: efflux RND transporter periplasmic adaptor subunit, partial [Chlamydiae bacterium]|nr:efflux RND transporter periplasmic adaptor subunit [Chlamydiota bacterium]